MTKNINSHKIVMIVQIILEKYIDDIDSYRQSKKRLKDLILVYINKIKNNIYTIHTYIYINLNQENGARKQYLLKMIMTYFITNLKRERYTHGSKM